MDRHITLRTVYRRIRSFGLTSYLYLVLPLTAEHRRQQLEWCNDKSDWNFEWRRIVSSDESRFCLGMHNGRMRVRIEEAKDGTCDLQLRDMYTARWAIWCGVRLLMIAGLPWCSFEAV